MTTPPPSWDEHLSGNSGKSAGFGAEDADPPVEWSGRIVELPAPIQEQDFYTKEPKFWDAEKQRPKWLRAIVIQPDKPVVKEDDNDDGLRVLWVDTPYTNRPNKGTAVREALQKAGSKAPEVDGWIRLAFTHWQQPIKPGARKAKGYAAEYRPPTPGDGWGADTAPPATAPAAAPAPTSAPTPPATDPNIAVLINKGLDAAKVMAMDEATRAMVAGL